MLGHLEDLLDMVVLNYSRLPLRLLKEGLCYCG
jgi:hypothetical protein